MKMKKLLHSKNTKKIGVAIVAASLTLSMTACSSSTNTTAEIQAVDEIVETQAEADTSTPADANGKENAPEGFNNEGGYFGKITAIDGNTITVSVMNGRAGGGRPDGEKPNGEMPSKEMPDGEKPDGEMPTGEMPNGEKTDGEMPTDEMPNVEKPDGEMPTDEMPNGEKPDREMPEGMSSETMTIEVSESTVITVNGETADVSALEVGSTIMFTLDGETALTITVGMPEQGTETTAE